jgi:glycerophosphoryl diester phosphodiesterase
MGERMKRRFLVMSGVGATLAAIYFANASWMANPPIGRPTIIAQRGVHQLFAGSSDDPNACKARNIYPPRHRLIENTLPSIRAAIDAGADIVEVDVRESADGEFILFHDAGLGCRTEKAGLVSQTTYDQMKSLDVGYGYTADGGKTYPLRGRGRGMMTTIDEVLRTFPTQRFLIQMKDGESAGLNLVLYIKERHPDAWNRIALFGDTPATVAAKKLRPDMPVIHDRRAAKCTLAYAALGWTGYVPEACREGTIIVAMNARPLAWGWPNRFLGRMGAAKVDVMAIGSVTGLRSNSFTRLDNANELSNVPTGFDGLIWTDRVEAIGPAVRKRWPR